MEDLIILLPGITGSVLSVAGRPVFEATNAMLISTWWRRGRNLDVLGLPPADGAAPVEATGLFLGPHWLLGMGWVNGYGPLSDLIVRELDTTHPGEPGNFHHFPYDWRLDNRDAAARLRAFVDEKLGWWREATENDEARVIFLAHSMGGLVARHYLEVLGGWDRCRMLISFGTPYRGSVEALKLLAAGVRRGGVNLTDVVRSFPSVYQLLPIYPVVEVEVGGEATDLRVAEMTDLPGVNPGRARDAREFYLELIARAEENRARGNWDADGYQTVPVIGSRQRTMQSARVLGDGSLEFRHDVLPRAVNALKWDGDGTVPRVSAVPLDHERTISLPIYAERHSSLQANSGVLERIFEWLYHLRARDGRPVLGGAEADRAGLSLDIADAYEAGAPVAFRCALDDPTGRLSGQLVGTITPVDAGTPSEFEVNARGGGWKGVAVNLAPGVYRVELQNAEVAGPVALPVHGVFEVLAAPGD